MKKAKMKNHTGNREKKKPKGNEREKETGKLRNRREKNAESI